MKIIITIIKMISLPVKEDIPMIVTEDLIADTVMKMRGEMALVIVKTRPLGLQSTGIINYVVKFELLKKEPMEVLLSIAK